LDVKSYPVVVQMVLARLLLLIAVLFLPLGMNAPAAAATHHGPMAGMAMSDRPDQPGRHQQKAWSPVCTMACASALPAFDRRDDDEIAPIARIAFAPLPAHPLHGLVPDIATPPPKAS
jgi:hypothetical protein